MSRGVIFVLLIILFAIIICSVFVWKCNVFGERHRITEDVNGVMLWTKGAKPFREDEFNLVIENYVSGNLSNEKPVVELPGISSSLTVDGRLYVTKGGNTNDMFMFLVWRGKGSNLEGYLYCKPGERNPISLNDGTLIIVGPQIYSKSGCGNVEVQIERIDAAGWYKVWRSLD